MLVEDGILRIWDRCRRLLAKIKRGRNRLYVLRLEVARPICLATRHDDVAWRWHERFEHIHFGSLEKMADKSSCVACLDWSMSSSFATRASSPSIGALPFQRQPSTALRSR